MTIESIKAFKNSLMGEPCMDTLIQCNTKPCGTQIYVTNIQSKIIKVRPADTCRLCIFGRLEGVSKIQRHSNQK